MRTLVQTVGLNGAATVVRLFTQIAITKIVAVSVGPAGLVVVGQIQNLISLLGSGSTLGLFGGVVKLTADGSVRQEQVWSTALGVSAINAAIWFILSVFFARAAAQFLFDDPGKAYIVVLCASANGLVVLQALISHILTGLRAFKLHIATSILNSVLYLAMVVTAATFGASDIIFVAICFSQAIQIFGAVVAFYLSPAITLRSFTFGINRSIFAQLSPFVMIGLATAITLPIVQSLVRSHLVKNFGITDAGYWEAAMKISMLYSSLLSAAFGLYLLPTFASAKTHLQLKSHLVQALGLVFIVLLIGAVLQYLLLDWIIVFIFSSSFAPAAELVLLHIPGDIARGLLVVLIFFASAQARSLLVITINLIFASAFYIGTLTWAVPASGTISDAAISYSIGNFIAFAFALFVLRHFLWLHD